MLLLSCYLKEYSMNKQKRDIGETFRRYYRFLCLYAIHYLHDMDLVEDVVQNTRKLEKKGKFQQKSLKIKRIKL